MKLTPIPLRWRLHTVMSENGIRTSSELHRRLEPYGIDITSHQLSRIVAGLPQRLNTKVLAALMTELRCSASDLLVPDTQALEAGAQAPKPQRPVRRPPSVPADIGGPKVLRLKKKTPDEKES